ncbi:30S ribosomal protein S12 technical knockout [Arctopsyche grandis]|uniref:30S ribosomal protein S12 technical knockout n=1 Tax=Arctopsyche grandis TaxID=121162 RepID=UPI00406D7F9B
MNFLRRGFSLLSSAVSIVSKPNNFVAPPILDKFSFGAATGGPMTILSRCVTSLYRMHRTGPLHKIRKNRNPLGNAPFAKGVVLKTLIKKPKKPNSANRKCVLVKLSNNKEMVAYIPGIGHNLQEHNIVLVRVGRVKDCPGVKLKCVRGKFDLPHVIRQPQS